MAKKKTKEDDNLADAFVKNIIMKHLKVKLKYNRGSVYSTLYWDDDVISTDYTCLDDDF